MSSFGVILLAVDKSEHSGKVVSVARALSKLSGGTVHLLHVREKAEFEGKSGGSFEMETEEEAQSFLAEELSMLRETGVDVEIHLRQGKIEDTSVAIIDVAEEVSADVIVMGSKGLSALAALTLGSTTYSVLHTSKRPVLVVP